MNPNATDPDGLPGMLKWLSPLDYSGVHAQHQHQLLPGTCQWFFESSIFHSWKNRPKQRLWCIGSAGAGKTCLASMIIQSLLDDSSKRRPEDPKVQVPFLYLTYKEHPSINQLLGSLAKQIVGTSQKMTKVLREVWQKEYGRGGNFESPPTLAFLSRLLLTLTTNCNTYVIIDALDEFDSEKRGELIDRLCQININLLVTSRYLEGFKVMTKSFQTIKVEAQKGDIDDYVDLAIAKNSRLSAFILRDPSLKEKIKMKINQRANGIFLMVRLHMEAIAVSLTSTEVRSILETLPSDPNSTYRNTLARINDQDPQKREWAKCILAWVHHAIRPLRVQELRHALAIQPGKPVFDHGRMLLEEDILSFCCGLVEIDSGLETIRL
ncbi:uncharacterized protein BKA78DRAFT_253128, partial [Phyllosticta capitalensis]|uniref:uncharacterized protein n=1 Tax=Phyllosticta capitalensis TaxID=121624 RepID=UPI00312F01E7